MPSARTSRLGAAVALLGALAVAACYPRFLAAPVGTAGDAAALSGAWQSQDGEDPRVTMTIACGEEPGAVGITIRDTDEEPAGDDLVLVGELVESGGGSLAALRDSNDPGDIGVMLFRFERAGDALTVTPVSDVRIAAAIRSGALAGTIEGEGPGATITVIATAEELTRYLSSPSGASAFAVPAANVLHFKRVTSAD